MAASRQLSLHRKDKTRGSMKDRQAKSLQCKNKRFGADITQLLQIFKWNISVLFVIPGLDPGIHGFLSCRQNVDGRDEARP
jgi:hypothetical protein